MSEYGEEGQPPEEQATEPGPENPPRPTVRESLRRGLFVRLPTEGDAGGVSSEEPAETYEGWRQTADGGWEPVNPEAYDYAEGYEPAPVEAEAVGPVAAPEQAPAEPLTESDQVANYASVAGGEPFLQPEESADSGAWSFGGYGDPVTAAAAEAAASAAAEAAAYAETAGYEQAAVEEPPAPEYIPAPEVAPEPVAAEPVAAEPEPAPSTSPVSDDSVAATGVYIPPDIELFEGDMPLYGEKDKIPPIFKGEGLGEPLFVEFADLPQVLTGLRRLLPPRTRLTYNYDCERAWIRASAEIDLPSFAERVEPLEEPPPPVST